MQSIRTDNAGSGRLRFVFDGAVVSVGFAVNTTLEDVARTLGDLEPQGYGNPVAIDVIMAAPSRSVGTLHSIHLA